MKAVSSNVQFFFRKDHAIAPAKESRAWPAAVAFSTEQRDAVGAHLTPRQLEVLALLCEGLPNKLICRRLNIATGTVKVRISCILRELGVTSRLQAVVAAGNLGLAGERTAGEPDEPADATSTARPAKPVHGGRGTTSSRTAVTI